MRIFTNRLDCRRSYLRSYACVPHYCTGLNLQEPYSMQYPMAASSLHTLDLPCTPASYLRKLNIFKALLTGNWSVTNAIPKA